MVGREISLCLTVTFTGNTVYIFIYLKKTKRVLKLSKMYAKENNIATCVYVYRIWIEQVSEKNKIKTGIYSK